MHSKEKFTNLNWFPLVTKFSFSSAQAKSLRKEEEETDEEVLAEEALAEEALEADGMEVVTLLTQLGAKLVVFFSFLLGVRGRTNGDMDVMFSSGRMSSALNVLEQHWATLAGRLSRRPIRSSLTQRSGKLKGRLSRR